MGRQLNWQVRVCAYETDRSERYVPARVIYVRAAREARLDLVWWRRFCREARQNSGAWKREPLRDRRSTAFNGNRKKSHSRTNSVLRNTEGSPGEKTSHNILLIFLRISHVLNLWRKNIWNFFRFYKLDSEIIKWEILVIIEYFRIHIYRVIHKYMFSTYIISTYINTLWV